MAFNGTEGKAIDLGKAADWASNYREAHNGEVQSRFFGRDILLTLLEQPGCEGIRIYYGLDGSVPQMMAVGVDSNENDQLGDNFIIADDTMCGPPRTGKNNALNS